MVLIAVQVVSALTPINHYQGRWWITKGFHQRLIRWLLLYPFFSPILIGFEDVVGSATPIQFNGIKLINSWRYLLILPCFTDRSPRQRCLQRIPLLGSDIFKLVAEVGFEPTTNRAWACSAGHCITPRQIGGRDGRIRTDTLQVLSLLTLPLAYIPSNSLLIITFLTKVVNFFFFGGGTKIWT